MARGTAFRRGQYIHTRYEASDPVEGSERLKFKCHRYATLIKGTCKPMRMAFPGSLYARLSGAKADNYQEKIRLKSYCLSVNETPNTRRTPRFKKLKLNGDSNAKLCVCTYFNGNFWRCSLRPVCKKCFFFLLSCC